MQGVRKFLVTSPNSPDGVVFGFKYNHLVFFEVVEEKLNEKGLGYLLNFLPKAEADFFKWVQEDKRLSVVELIEKITFEMFWLKYDHRTLSSKVRSEGLWKKMSKDNQVKAFYFIETYFRNIPAGTEKKYCETYLKNQLWNNT